MLTLVVWQSKSTLPLPKYMNTYTFFSYKKGGSLNFLRASMRFPYSHDILMCVQIIWKLQSHKPTSGTAAILRLPISSSSGIEKYYSQGLFFAMPLSLSFLQQRSYYSRYSEKYCMCALCVHWVCNNIQGALSPESLLRPSISLLVLNLGQKGKEYHIDANRQHHIVITKGLRW